MVLTTVLFFFALLRNKTRTGRCLAGSLSTMSNGNWFLLPRTCLYRDCLPRRYSIRANLRSMTDPRFIGAII